MVSLAGRPAIFTRTEIQNSIAFTNSSLILGAMEEGCEVKDFSYKWSCERFGRLGIEIVVVNCRSIFAMSKLINLPLEIALCCLHVILHLYVLNLKVLNSLCNV